MAVVRVKRGTRAQLDAAAAASGLLAGEPYLITDESRLAVGTDTNSYRAFARESDFHADTFPVGTMVPFGGTTAPDGWLWCNGAAVLRTTYSALFSVIGTRYGGGNGTTTFNLPNMAGRFVYGTDDPALSGQTGGGEMHWHRVVASTVYGSIVVGGNEDTSDIWGQLGTGALGYKHTHPASVDVYSSGQEPNQYQTDEDILPPFLRQVWIIKALGLVSTSTQHNTLDGRSAVGAHPATAITFTPTGTIAATTVQAAIAEVAAEAAGGGSPLTVKEDDGTPSVATVTELRFAGATVEEVSAGVAKITVTGGGTTPVLGTDAFTATAAQTDFVLSNAPLAGGIVYVSRDGVVARGADWSLTGSTVTFGTGLDAGTEVQITYWRTAPGGTTPTSESYTATADQTAFALSHTATAALLVAVNGVVQSASGWSLTGGGATLTFAVGVPEGSDVWIAYLY